MNKQSLKAYAKQQTARLQNSVLRVIAKFPPGDIWDSRHVDIAMDKLVENSELTPDQVIKAIKISDAGRYGRNWFQDIGKGKTELTQKEIDFNERVKNG
jgi:hypothetical protein